MPGHGTWCSYSNQKYVIRDQGSGIRDQGSGIRDQGSEIHGRFAPGEEAKPCDPQHPRGGKAAGNFF
ncbi:MAG: hypothetical protein LBI62_09340 [Candidatus Accumulibacter sp.]|nr:hypothetical protein [Accumulibacter sp.]